VSQIRAQNLNQYKQNLLKKQRQHFKPLKYIGNRV